MDDRTRRQQQRERLYGVMERANDLVERFSQQERNTLIGSTAWQEYKALEEAAGDERAPARLTHLVDQLDSALAALERGA